MQLVLKNSKQTKKELELYQDPILAEIIRLMRLDYHTQMQQKVACVKKTKS